MRLIRWINASAGTGKTHKVKELICDLVNSGVNPESILCLTFTTAGAMEMKHRYLQTSTSSKTPAFETIHSFAKKFNKSNSNVMTDDMVQQLVQEAIELVLLNDEWEEFFQSIHQIWTTIMTDIKQIITSGLPIRDTFLQNYISKHCKFERIQVSNSVAKALIDSGLQVLLDRIVSNNIEIYSASFVTKELKLNKRILPPTFVNNPDYEKVNEELREVFHKILGQVLEFQNWDYLRQSFTCNLFMREISMKYQELKKLNNLIDFNDMIQMALAQIKESSEDIMHIRHIFLDEAQDTSEVQWKFLYNMMLEVFQLDDVSFTIVGDRKQIIYQFNGASKSLYSKMKVKLEQTVQMLGGTWQELELDKSYRTAQTILDFVDTVMQSTNYPCDHVAAIEKTGYVKTWLPLKSNKDHLILSKGWVIPDEQQIPKWIYLCIDEIKALIGQKKLLNEDRLIEADDIAILVPRRYIHNFILVEELKKNKIPVKNSLFGMGTDDTVQDLLSVGSIALDIRNDLMIVNVLKNLYFSWTDEQVEDLVINRDDTIWGMMSHSREPHVQKAVQAIQEWINFPKDLVTFYSKVIFHTEFGKSLMQNFRAEVLLFWEKVLSLSHLSLSEFIFYIHNSYEPFNVDRKGISVLTTHAAKGKEFNVVFLCNSHLSLTRNPVTQVIHDNMFLLKGNYDLYKSAKNKITLEQENESDRLLYVALTRAREQLYVLPPLSTDNINPKSWYSKIVKNLHMFTENEEAYELLCPKSQKQQKCK